MKITFDPAQQTGKGMTPEVPGSGRQARAQKSVRADGFVVEWNGKSRVGFAQDKAGRGRQKDMAAIQEAAEGIDVQIRQNQMTVMSHTMSDEDFAKMSEEGYSPKDMDPEDFVTILDKIKAELVKAGKHIVGYTDTLDMDTLAAAVGDAGLAREIASAFSQADIPLTDENVEKTVQAAEMAAALEAPAEGDYYYMIANDMDPTVRDFTYAEASGSQVRSEQKQEYFGEAVKGYYTKNVSGPETAVKEPVLDMDAEVDRLLSRLGLEGTEQEKQAAAWLIERGLPADAEAIQRYCDIASVAFPLEDEVVLAAAADAIAKGEEPMDGDLADAAQEKHRLGYMKRAVELYEIYQGESAVTMVQDRRQLEEIRLRMTVEVNLKLLESGFSIDTAPIEETIEALKRMEEELAKQYFPGEQEPVEKYRLLQEVSAVIDELPHLPAQIVGDWTERFETGDLAQFHQEGKALESAFAEAQTRYEAIWTAPRADMGDSIRKAFANVDDILEDMGCELTEENRKAVRILGYNHMEINEENLLRVKEAYQAVDQVIRKMTPAATLQMIRDGVNPLEKTLPQLREYFDGQPEEYQEASERYSRFLCRLEKNNEITEQEREAFIGCYRLLRQIEKSDGAVIGAIVNVGAELNFSTVLSAVRSGKFRSLNMAVSDAVGAVSKVVEKGVSISEQIGAGFSESWNTIVDQAPEQADAEMYREYAEEVRQMMAQAAEASESSFERLARGEMEPSAQNLLAAQAMEEDYGAVLARQMDKSRDRERFAKRFERLGEKDFDREYREELETQIEAVETEVYASEDRLDIRQMQLFHKQLHLMRNLAGSGEYYFPMAAGEETINVHLQLKREDAGRGTVRIELTDAGQGSLKGELRVTEGKIKSYFVGNREETVRNLRGATDIFLESFAKEGFAGEMEFVYSDSGRLPESREESAEPGDQTTETLYRLAKSFLQTYAALR